MREVDSVHKHILSIPQLIETKLGTIGKLQVLYQKMQNHLCKFMQDNFYDLILLFSTLQNCIDSSHCKILILSPMELKFETQTQKKLCNLAVGKR